MTYDAKLEDERYSALHAGKYADGPIARVWNWSHRLIDWEKVKHVLDIGCGSAKFSTILPPGTDYTGVDISSWLIDHLREKYPQHRFIHSCLTKMSFDRSFGLAICLNVLEHLPEDMIDDAISTVASMSGVVLIHVACRPSTIVNPDGTNLHKTVRRTVWWRRRIEKAMPISLYIEAGSYGMYLCGPQAILDGRKRRGHSLNGTVEPKPLATQLGDP